MNGVVHNKKGEPVRDLAKEDFVLFDKGQEQKILFLDETTYAQALKSGITVNVQSDAPSPSARARLIVHDLASGSGGSMDLPFK